MDPLKDSIKCTYVRGKTDPTTNPHISVPV